MNSSNLLTYDQLKVRAARVIGPAQEDMDALISGWISGMREDNEVHAQTVLGEFLNDIGFERARAILVTCTNEHAQNAPSPMKESYVWTAEQIVKRFGECFH